MGCLEREAVCEYLDGRLDGRRAGAMREHLRECPECSAEAEALAALAASVAALPRTDPGPSFTAAVMAVVQRSVAQAPQVPFALVFWDLVGLAALSGGAMLLLVRVATWAAQAPLAAWTWHVDQGHRVADSLRTALDAVARAPSLPWLSEIPSAAGLAAVLAAAVVLLLLARPPAWVRADD